VSETGRKPSVVVGISTCNRAGILPKAITSALTQNYPNIRIFVTDDASTDDTPSIHSDFPDATWWRFEVRQGYVTARNRIIFSSHENYYVSLDDDAWFLRGDEIALAVDLLERQPKVAAVAFDIVSPDRPQAGPRGTNFFVSMFIGCGHVLRLSTVKSLGGYSVFPGAYGVEEKDLCLRLIDAGYEIVQMQGVEVWHDKTMTARDLASQHASGVCNDLTFTLGRFPLLLLFPMLGYKVASHLLFAVRHSLVGPCLEGLRNFARAGWGAWRSRRPVRMVSLARYRALSRAPQRIGG
jgi:GT2 family glycosyltransferase